MVNTVLVLHRPLSFRSGTDGLGFSWFCYFGCLCCFSFKCYGSGKWVGTYRASGFCLYVSRICAWPSGTLFVVALRRLRCVLTIGRFHRFTGTTRCYHIARPALDTVVRGLRRRLSAQVFSHDRRPMYPAPINVRVVRRTRGVLIRTGHVGGVVRRRGRSLANVFGLNVLPAMTPCLLPHFFPRLVGGCPSLSVQMIRVGAGSVGGTLRAKRVSTNVMTDLTNVRRLRRAPLFCRRFFTCISHRSTLFGGRMVHASSLGNRRL